MMMRESGNCWYFYILFCDCVKWGPMMTVVDILWRGRLSEVLSIDILGIWWYKYSGIIDDEWLQWLLVWCVMWPRKACVCVCIGYSACVLFGLGLVCAFIHSLSLVQYSSVWKFDICYLLMMMGRLMVMFSVEKPLTASNDLSVLF